MFFRCHTLYHTLTGSNSRKRMNKAFPWFYGWNALFEVKMTEPRS